MAHTKDQIVLRDHANTCFQKETPAIVTQDLRLVKHSVEGSIIIQHNHYHNHAISTQLSYELEPLVVLP